MFKQLCGTAKVCEPRAQNRPEEDLSFKSRIKQTIFSHIGAMVRRSAMCCLVKNIKKVEKYLARNDAGVQSAVVGVHWRDVQVRFDVSISSDELSDLKPLSAAHLFTCFLLFLKGLQFTKYIFFFLNYTVPLQVRGPPISFHFSRSRAIYCQSLWNTTK